MVYRLAFAHTKNRGSADDIFQDVFLRYISKPRTFESEEHRKAWLIRVTINCCNSMWSRSQTWLKKTEPLTDTIPFETKEESNLFEVIMTLPLKYRTVIHLFYYEDFSVKQISEVIRAKESTIRTWLTRARTALKEKLKEDYFYE
jgi:RNA polymerase sigma-70 factor (ECF subfamily)